MTNQELADAIIERLNALIENGAVRHDLGALINVRIPCLKDTASHPTIQVEQAAADAPPMVGLLGILNGLVGIVPEGNRKGCGLIGASFDDNGHLLRFVRAHHLEA